MSPRVYVLLDIEDFKSDQAVQILRGKSGVMIADALEGPPDVIIVIEASEREKLADLTMEVLESIESVTEGVHLLPAQDGSNTYAFSKSTRRRRKLLSDKGVVL